MKITPIFQTLEDRNNYTEIKNHGPFFCKICDDSGKIKKGIKEPWLGEGYYFWDTRISDAHWWGQTIYENKGYVIYQTSYDQHSDFLFDTVGDVASLDFLLYTADLLKDKLKIHRINLIRVLDFLKENTDFGIKYKAIRVWPQAQSKHINHPEICFEKSSFCLSKMEKIQICFFDKTLLINPFVKVYNTPSTYSFTV